MYIIIDIGNTNQKAALFNEDGQMEKFYQKGKLTSADINEWLEQYVVKSAIISSVGEDGLNLYAWLNQRVPTIIMSAQIALPIRLKYNTPETLGTDRIANAVGANSLFPNQNVLSIQAGSCLVTDLVTKDNEYIGGTIAPGLRMRFRALDHFTAKLPLLEPAPINYLAGQSTEQSILSGVINGMVSEINGLIDAYQSQYSDLQIVMTGGDIIYLENMLKNRIFAAQNLVLLGLYKILRLHAAE